MAKAKRVKGERLAPDLPKLEEHHFTPYLWEGANKATWSLEEAACYLHEANPSGFTPDLSAKDPINRAYVWLHKENKEDRLKSHIAEERFSPGSIMRYCWENHRSFSLITWAIYDLVTSLEEGKTPHTKVFKGNYITAARAIWKEYPNISKNKMVDFLLSIAGKENRESGLPFFFATSRDTLLKTFQGDSPLGKGAPKDGSTINPLEEPYKQDILNLLRKEIG